MQPSATQLGPSTSAVSCARRICGAEMDAVYEDRHTALLDEERAQDLGPLHAAEDAAVEADVRRQEEIGLDVISDGEARRRMYTSSFYDAVEGLAPSPMTLEFRDEAGDVVEFPDRPSSWNDCGRSPTRPPRRHDAWPP